MRQVRLNIEYLRDKETMARFLKWEFRLPDYFGGNLDALNDCLSEVTEDIEIVIDHETITSICNDAYAYKVLMVLGRAVEENPHLKIAFLER